MPLFPPPSLPKTGGALTGPLDVVTGADGNRLWLAKYTVGTGHTNAPTTISPESTYMQVGGREYNLNSYRLIGFGYVPDTNTNTPAFIGYQEKDTPGDTFGDLVFGTRNVNSNTPASVRMAIKSSGEVSLPSTSPGMYIYNTADETTNYRRMLFNWDSGNFVLRQQRTGSAGPGFIIIDDGTGRSFSVGSISSDFSFFDNGTTNSQLVNMSGIFSSSATNQATLNLSPTISQSGTAGYTALRVNVTESTTGSGDKMLADFQVGGASRAQIHNTGDIEVNTNGAGIILKSPDGTRYRLVVANGGALSTIAA